VVNHLKTAIVTFGILGMAFAGPSAKADIFDFTITNARGNVSGSVTGEIFGLVNNSTSAASEVLITDFPAGLNSALGGAPINATAWAIQMENSFTETNGQITAADFAATQPVGGSVPAQLYIMNGEGFLSLDGVSPNGNMVYGSITFTADPTPEPGYLLLVALGLGGLVLMKSRRNRQRLSQQ
jgi:hypothetical protein